MTVTINLFGGPGTGKSTIGAMLFALLKMRGVNAELIGEYAKRKVWEKSIAGVAKDQLYMFAKQHHAIFCCLGEVDVIVTDSPVILSLHHGRHMSETFKALVMESHHSQNPVNIFLSRVKPYSPIGRTETKERAREMDTEFRAMMDERGISYEVIDGDQEAAHKIVEILVERGLVPN